MNMKQDRVTRATNPPSTRAGNNTTDCLYVCFSVCVCLSMATSLCLPLSLTAFLYLRLSICQPESASIYVCPIYVHLPLSVCLPGCLPLSVCLSLYLLPLSLSLTACLYLRRSICQRESASICVSVWLSASACVSLLLHADNMYVHLRMHLSVV